MAGDLTVHLLDMGDQKYGDCIVCQVGGKTILIDGGHQKDFKGQPGYESVPAQLRKIDSAALKPDLLIVTHCHSDHIGCLPEMIAAGMLRPTWALVADEDLGFGKGGGDDAPSLDALPDTVGRVVAALREEDVSDLKNDQLNDFLLDAVTLEQRYRKMLSTLEGAGCRIVRYGRDSTTALEKVFDKSVLTVLGPTRTHLQICSKAIAAFTQDAVDGAMSFVNDSPDLSAAALYRSLARSRGTDAIDKPGLGAALNNQSIVCIVGAGANKVLLTGDMQFAKPEIKGLGTEMDALRQIVRGAAPFAAAKLAHHASYNGFDDTVMTEWGATSTLVMSGGRVDPGHPDPGVLKLLRNNRDHLQWARTDRNGHIVLTVQNGKAALRGSGTLNSATPNGGDAAAVQSLTSSTSAVTPDGTTVEVLTRVPHTRTRVTITIDVDPASGSAVAVRSQETASTSGDRGSESAEKDMGPIHIGRGRDLKPLLFATDTQKLAKNIGADAVDRIVSAIRSSPHALVDLAGSDGTAAALAPIVGKKIQDAHVGVVIVGGYDVVPPSKLDVLEPSVRARLQEARQIDTDPDGFTVWTDSFYGDRDGDNMPELPVSRIPDGKSADLVVTALQADRPVVKVRFGLRNDQRPFAIGVFDAVAGDGDMLRSEDTIPGMIPNGALDADAVYLMLHGSDAKGSAFWGEDAGGSLEAINVSNLKNRHVSVVFTGCCWGALVCEPPAYKFTAASTFRTRTAAESMALAFLQAGALAFIGCTGAHYSPLEEPYNHAGGPMHKAFWKYYNAGQAPSLALFDAKKEYLGDIPHGRPDISNRAKEMKILREYTCLGLGW